MTALIVLILQIKNSTIDIFSNRDNNCYFSLSLLSASQPKYWCVQPVEKPVSWRTQSADSRGYQSADDFSTQSTETPQSLSADTNSLQSAGHSSLLSADLPSVHSNNQLTSDLSEYSLHKSNMADISIHKSNMADISTHKSNMADISTPKSNMAASGKQLKHLDDFYIDMTGVEPKAGTIVSSK